MTTVAAGLIPDLVFAYNDPNATSITTANWLTLLNDAIRQVIQVRPDAYTQVKVLTLVEGTRQSIPSGDVRLVQLTRNMESDETTPGNAILGPWKQEDIDASEPTWHTTTAGSAVTGFTWNDALPRDFLVYPPVSAGTKVEAVVSTLPAVISADTDTIPLGGQFYPALIQWALYRAYGRDHERSPNAARAAQHKAAFYEALGVKNQGDAAVSPPRAEAQ